MSIDNNKLKVCPKITDTSVTDKGDIRICWTEVPGAEKYAVQRAEKAGGEYERIAWAKKTAYTDTTAKRDVTYWYRIVAQKELENKKKSKKASPVAAQVISSIPAPDSLKVKAKGAKIHLKWKCPEGVESFVVYRRNDNFEQLLPVASAQGDSFTDESIARGQIYHYSVQSLCEGGQGNFSKQVYCVSLDSGEIVSCRAGLFGRIDLEARIVAGADGYIFERSSDGEDFEEFCRTDSNVSLRCSDKAKRSFTVYCYRVRAYKNVCGELIISKPSKTVKIKSK